MEIFGLDTETLNALAGGGASAIIFLLMRVIFVKVWGDNQLQSQLVHFASDAMNKTDKMLEAYEGNTAAIRQVGDVLGEVQKAFTDLSERVITSVESVKTNVDPIVKSIQVIQDNMLRTSETTVILRDEDGVDVASFKAKPELDSDGTTVLVVTFNYFDNEPNIIVIGET